MAEQTIEVNKDMNLYEMNKQIIQQTEKGLSRFKINELKREVIVPFFGELFGRHTYAMLLCKERADYTLFRRNPDCGKESPAPWNSAVEAAKILIECLDNRGYTIYSVELTQDKSALEIWAKDPQEDAMLCYYLFCYDEGVIEV